MTDLRRAVGSLTKTQLNRALKSFPGMSEQNQSIVRDVLVGGELQTDVAQRVGLSRERVRYLCAQVYDQHLKLLEEAAAKGSAKTTRPAARSKLA
ncbi:TrfB-related DNA-binding protein [Eleftheria terrae]|uniref:TrfB-related DNA-binding protein n=1 Tax=Eleftheria terrae TaxID=1597781 RepID=UPI00263AD824|nr:TrfB-related DNA-binding protein [Eleftheria terrae]WKB50533.1 transcriptional regulator KorA [Eleftheria terrae]